MYGPEKGNIHLLRFGFFSDVARHNYSRHRSLHQAAGDSSPVANRIQVLDFCFKIALHCNFGGIKLGAGGLVRAYTKGAKVGIEAGIVIEKVKYSEVKIKIEYTQLGRIQNEIMNLGFKVKDTIYSEDVELIVYVRNEEAKSLMDRIIDITSGTADVSLGEEYYLSEKDGELIL